MAPSDSRGVNRCGHDHLACKVQINVTVPLSGLRNPYPGRLGVVEQGAFADLILVEGNPLEQIALVADAVNNCKIIMKDGKIHKNTLPDLV